MKHISFQYQSVVNLQKRMYHISEMELNCFYDNVFLLNVKQCTYTNCMQTIIKEIYSWIYVTKSVCMIFTCSKSVTLEVKSIDSVFQSYTLDGFSWRVTIFHKVHAVCIFLTSINTLVSDFRRILLQHTIFHDMSKEAMKTVNTTVHLPGLMKNRCRYYCIYGGRCLLGRHNYEPLMQSELIVDQSCK